MTRTQHQASRPVMIDGTITLTYVWQQFIMCGNKENHELGNSQTDYLRYGMVASRESKEERHAVSVRSKKSQKPDRRALYCASFSDRGYEQGKDTRKTEQVAITQNGNSLLPAILQSADNRPERPPGNASNVVQSLTVPQTRGTSLV